MWSVPKIVPFDTPPRDFMHIRWREIETRQAVQNMVGVYRGNRRDVLGSACADAGFEFALRIFLGIHSREF